MGNNNPKKGEFRMTTRAYLRRKFDIALIVLAGIAIMAVLLFLARPSSFTDNPVCHNGNGACCEPSRNAALLYRVQETRVL